MLPVIGFRRFSAREEQVAVDKLCQRPCHRKQRLEHCGLQAWLGYALHPRSHAVVYNSQWSARAIVGLEVSRVSCPNCSGARFESIGQDGQYADLLFCKRAL